MSSHPLGTLWEISDFFFFFFYFLTLQEIYKETAPKQNLELFYPKSGLGNQSHGT